MATLAIILTIFAALPSLIWLGRHIRISREGNGGFVLTDAYGGPPESAPKISMLVAAKDEQDNIEACVRGLAGQDYPNFEIIVCNDRSDDRTGKIIDNLAAEFDSVTAIHINELPDGWKGKNHAMHVASQQASGEYLFFTDADCRHTSPRMISVAVQLIIDKNVALLSMLPVLETKSFWENVIQPLCAGVMMLWFEPNRVNNPKSTAAYANGAFMLMTREGYDKTGGHEAMRNVMQEDMLFARIAKARGLGVYVARSRGLFVVRMYTSLPQMFNGWTRIFFGSIPQIRRLIISFVALVLVALFPYIAMVLGYTMAGESAANSNWWLACGIAGTVSCVMQLTAIYRFYKLILANKYLCWTYVIGCIIVCSALLRAMLMHRPGAKVTWKGTTFEAKTRQRRG
ncbi:MAG: glycosyltransferase [Phycisphaerae bacterium]|nr:glycosyltransferase [Phycisphaerae bacterium]